MSNFLEKFKGKISAMPKQGIEQAIVQQASNPIKKESVPDADITKYKAAKAQSSSVNP